MGLGSYVRTGAPVRISASSEPGAEESGCGRKLTLPGESQENFRNGGVVSLSEPWSRHLLNAGIGQEWFLVLANCHSHPGVTWICHQGHCFPTCRKPHVHYIRVLGAVCSGPTLHGCLHRPLLLQPCSGPRGTSPQACLWPERAALLWFPVLFPS